MLKTNRGTRKRKKSGSKSLLFFSLADLQRRVLVKKVVLQVHPLVGVVFAILAFPGGFLLAFPFQVPAQRALLLVAASAGWAIEIAV